MQGPTTESQGGGLPLPDSKACTVTATGTGQHWPKEGLTVTPAQGTGDSGAAAGQ